jgi:hypothetical protein
MESIGLIIYRNNKAVFHSSMFFSNNTIYSYGYHFAIAKHMENENGKFVLFTTRSYSNTTAKHQSKMRYSIRHLKVIECNWYIQTGEQSLAPNSYYTDLWRGENVTNGANLNADIIESVENQANRLYEKSLKARKNKEILQNQAYDLINSLRAYADFFGLVYDAPLSFEQLNENIKNHEALKAEQRRIAAENRIKAQVENLQKWLNGENVSAWFEVTALRINGDNIETSRGARIPVEHAIKFYPLIKKWNDSGKEYTKENHSIHLGNYTVESFKNGVLTVGCHDIPYSEIDRISKLLGL